jgi:hypothetical protein
VVYDYFGVKVILGYTKLMTTYDVIRQKGPIFGGLIPIFSRFVRLALGIKTAF